MCAPATLRRAAESRTSPLAALALFFKAVHLDLECGLEAVSDGYAARRVLLRRDPVEPPE